MNGQQQQQGVEATTVLTAKLEAQQWQVIIAGLQELPLKHSGSVMQALMAQLQQGVEPLTNGVDKAAGPIEYEPGAINSGPIPAL